MNKNCRAYWVVHDGNLFEDRPELICSSKVVIDPGFDQKQLDFERNGLFNIWPKDVSVVVSGDQPVDLLMCSPYIDIVSECAKSIIEEISGDHAEFLPVKVYHDNGNPYTQMNFWVLHVMTFLDALDWENTMWTEPSPPSKDDPMAILSIIKPCLKTQLIENHHLYGIEVAGKIRYEKYVSPTLKNALTKSGCSIGIEFVPVKTI